MGFTLLEVLVATLILSIGLLGLAGLQFSALRSNTQSYERSQAVALAYEIVDRMRANHVAANDGHFIIDAFEIRDSEVNCEIQACTQEQSADYELAQWQQRLIATLPGATASIEQRCVPGIACAQRSTHVVRVLWNENRTEAKDASCPAAEDFDPSVHLSCVQMSIST